MRVSGGVRILRNGCGLHLRRRGHPFRDAALRTGRRRRGCAGRRRARLLAPSTAELHRRLGETAAAPLFEPCGRGASAAPPTSPLSIRLLVRVFGFDSCPLPRPDHRPLSRPDPVPPRLGPVFWPRSWPSLQCIHHRLPAGTKTFCAWDGRCRVPMVSRSTDLRSAPCSTQRLLPPGSALLHASARAPSRLDLYAHVDAYGNGHKRGWCRKRAKGRWKGLENCQGWDC